MNRDTELLIQRATPLVFGVFGHIEALDGTRIVRVGGSGVFIAPFQVLTARHVCRDLFRTDPNRADDLGRRTSGYFKTPHSSVLFQVCDPFGPAHRTAIWQVGRSWVPGFTDICLMEVSAEGDEAAGRHHEMPTRFFDWSLLPPPVGSSVVMLGYPQAEVTITGDLMNICATYVLQEGIVTDISPHRRDSALYSFPGFQIDHAVDHGFSGGPVFHRNRLCGIVSGGILDGGTYAASLWPLCLMEYRWPDLGSLGQEQSFAELFDRGVLHAPDWRTIKGRISKQYDERGQPFAVINAGVMA